MTKARQEQIDRQIKRLRLRKERMARRGRYDKANKAHALIQSALERWATEVFASHNR